MNDKRIIQHAILYVWNGYVYIYLRKWPKKHLSISALLIVLLFLIMLHSMWTSLALFSQIEVNCLSLKVTNSVHVEGK